VSCLYISHRQRGLFFYTPTAHYGIGTLDTSKIGAPSCGSAWVRCFQKDWTRGQVSVKDQRAAAINGALFPFCKNIKLYRCSTGYPDEVRAYSVVGAINGYPYDGGPGGLARLDEGFFRQHLLETTTQNWPSHRKGWSQNRPFLSDYH